MIRLPSLSVLLLLGLIAVAFAVVPLRRRPYEVSSRLRVLATAIFVLGLDLLIGVNGPSPFWPCRLVRPRAYAVRFVTPPDYEAGNLLVALGALSRSPGAVAAVVGLFAVRHPRLLLHHGDAGGVADDLRPSTTRASPAA